MQLQKWLALETSTDTLSLAVARGDQIWTHTGAGGAHTSATMLPQSLALLSQANLTLHELDAVVFGRGPGAFTGLRTSCAVAQGLAFGASLKVLPIDTLLAVAEEARFSVSQSSHASAPHTVTRVLSVIDARMDQLYVAAYEYTAAGDWVEVQAAELQSPEALRWPAAWAANSFIAAGNAWQIDAQRWPAQFVAQRVHTLPTAAALVRLAPRAMASGQAVLPEHALPLYVRDKVAQTTEERLQEKNKNLAL